MTEATAASGATPSDAPEPVFRLLYRSHSRIDPGDRPVVLADIFRTARARNKEAGITGALLLTDNWFVQALEGSDEAVDRLYARIRQDPRHEDVVLLESGTVAARVFTR